MTDPKWTGRKSQDNQRNRLFVNANLDRTYRTVPKE